MPVILLQYIDELIFVLALTIDTFTISVLYGSQRIEIPFLSNVILNLTATLVLLSAIFFGSFLKQWIPEEATHYLSFLILCGIGGYKCVESLTNPKLQDGDRNHDKILSAKEALSISLALSMDGISIGLGAAFLSVDFVVIGILSLLVGMIAIIIGTRMGRILVKTISLDYSLVGGIAMIVFAFTKI
ncbi:MAG: manganese efflux pump [Eubacteriales bacterium]